MKKEYEMRFYLPEGYENNSEGKGLYFRDLVKSGSRDEVLLFCEVIKLMTNYVTYKEKEPVQDAIVNTPE